MNTSKHTKGDWDYNFPEHAPNRIYIHSGSDLPLAQVHIVAIGHKEAVEEAEANAKLIVSSPKLLELLNEFVIATNEYVISKEGHGCTWGIKATTLESARKLIKEINK